MSDTERTLPSGAILDDRRTEADVAATEGFVVATDSFMSGWGKAQGRSFYAVPFRNCDDAEVMLQNMKDRHEMKRARIVFGKHYHPKMHTGDHLSITSIEGAEGFRTPGWFKNQQTRAQEREERQAAGGQK